MPSSTSPRGWRDAHGASREVALWLGVLAGPLVWLALLETNYVLSYVSCEVRQTWFLHLASIVSLVAVAGAGVMAWRGGARGKSLRETAEPIGPNSVGARIVWMGYAGVAMSVWFAIVILSMEVPVLLLPPCLR